MDEGSGLILQAWNSNHFGVKAMRYGAVGLAFSALSPVLRHQPIYIRAHVVMACMLLSRVCEVAAQEQTFT